MKSLNLKVVFLVLCVVISGAIGLNMNTLFTRSPIYTAKTVDGKFCAIPFVHNGVTHHDCTMEGSDKPWCSLDKRFVSGQSKWGYCAPPPKEFQGCLLATPNITMEEVDEILREHNNFRATRPAVQMRKMEWNSELAMKAQVAANKCTHNHVESELCADRYETGQNLYYSYDSMNYPGLLAWSEVINAWSREVKDYDIATLKCNDTKLCGHYTQVVWDKSGQIGCGKGYCHVPHGDPSNLQYSIQYFCNYFESGNYLNTPPYKVSEKDRCQNCYLFDLERKFKCTNDHLCEVCQNDLEGCQGMNDIKLLVSQGKLCADTHTSCEQNKHICGMPRSPYFPPPVLELMDNCNKTCGRC